MPMLLLAFIAGVLTVAAPCILPLLPVIVGGSSLATDKKEANQSSWRRPLVITLSLVVSVVIFSLLLKATTALLGVPQIFWQIISGAIILLFGMNLLFPIYWEKLMVVSGLHVATNKWLGSSASKAGWQGDVLLGAALGPVFSSCSPTYALIIAVILPASFIEGLTYLIFYAAGLGVALFIIGIAGQAAVKKLGWLANPNGWFKRSMGILFIVVGLSVIFGLDKKAQSFILDKGWYNPIANIEETLHQ